MKREKNSERIAVALFGRVLVVATLILMSAPGVAYSNDLVACRYLKAQGNDIQLQLDIGTPPPATIIVTQNLPVGVTVSYSNPKIKKFDKSRGVAKWLLRGVKPGRLLMTMKLGNQVQASDITGEVRYMDAQSGKMVTIRIAP